ncbi:MAG: muconolactone Delta-isomerase family protein [Burkholderiaceae bacterium]|jgi:muconolactone D-isomerase|nr:muconolactone Delta-isomerase family protein [Burkholderiales bacterium]MCZ8102063.1 muconolactone Delta-isomerase family protein [Burkholderiales bacterium]MCZ8337877.1 muconolactone Delta-isomerase family protein [Burkholderiaceae bacterium]
MMFLIRMATQLPGDWPPEKTAELRARELELGIRYMEQGLLRRVFRTIGEDGNASLWEAESLESLHDALRALPKFPWARIVVTPLVEHPIEREVRARHGSLPSFRGAAS